MHHLCLIHSCGFPFANDLHIVCHQEIYRSGPFRLYSFYWLPSPKCLQPLSQDVIAALHNTTPSSRADFLTWNAQRQRSNGSMLRPTERENMERKTNITNYKPATFYNV